MIYMRRERPGRQVNVILHIRLGKKKKKKISDWVGTVEVFNCDKMIDRPVYCVTVSHSL